MRLGDHVRLKQGLVDHKELSPLVVVAWYSENRFVGEAPDGTQYWGLKRRRYVVTLTQQLINEVLHTK